MEDNNGTKVRKRDVKLDIIRIFAFLCVVSIHFFLNSGFYKETIKGKEMYIMCIFRSLFIISVPMFITLTGYLMNKKEISKKYYKGIIKVIVIYFMCSIVYSLFIKYYQQGEMNLGIFIKNLLSYSGTKYSWYIEMYIGLFLIIPFLNLVFNNLKSQRQAKLLIFTLVVIIGLPTLLNTFKLDSLEWWRQPSLDKTYTKILPTWWSAIYPIFYYYLGAYLRKYPIKMSAILNFFLIIIWLIIDGAFNYYRSYGANYIWGTWNNYSSILVMITTFLIFNLLLKINLKENKNVRDKIFKTISDACLGAYLLSCCFDIIFYAKLEELIPDVKERFIYAPAIICLVFACSIIASMIINLIYFVINKIFEKTEKN